MQCESPIWWIIQLKCGLSAYNGLVNNIERINVNNIYLIHNFGANIYEIINEWICSIITQSISLQKKRKFSQCAMSYKNTQFSSNLPVHFHDHSNLQMTTFISEPLFYNTQTLLSTTEIPLIPLHNQRGDKSYIVDGCGKI